MTLKSGVMVRLFNVFEKVFYAHQVYIYFIKNIVKHGYFKMCILLCVFIHIRVLLHSFHHLY